MAQTLYQASGITADNTPAIKEACLALAGAKWINVMADKIVVTHDDSFNEAGFFDTVKSVDAGVSLTKG